MKKALLFLLAIGALLNSQHTYSEQEVLNMVLNGSAANVHANSSQEVLNAVFNSVHDALNVEIIGEAILDTTVIDATSTEAFLVRCESDTGDVFVVDTENERVGIGTAEPGQKLDVIGNIRSSTGTFLPGAAQNVTGIGSRGLVTFGLSTGGNALLVNDIAGANHALATGGYDLTFYKHKSGDSTYYPSLIINGGAADGYPSGYSFYTGTTEKVTIDSDGNVGIGDSSPDANLEVVDDFMVSSTAGGDGDLFKVESDGNATFGGTVNGTEIHTTATNNLGLGTDAVDSITTGDYNTGVGDDALTACTEGDNNVASGFRSLYSNTTGSSNTAIGHASLYDVNTGSNNIGLGYYAGRSSSPSGTITTGSNIICLGNNSITNAHIKVAWTVSSDERDKADITDMTNGLDVINNITPINYVWDNRSDYWDISVDDEGNEVIVKNDCDGSKKKTGDLRTGFSAQNVKSALDAVGYEGNSVVNSTDDENLKITETNLIPFLVNAVKELSAQNEELKARIEALEE